MSVCVFFLENIRAKREEGRAFGLEPRKGEKRSEIREERRLFFFPFPLCTTPSSSSSSNGLLFLSLFVPQTFVLLLRAVELG